jgi:hypothetical protein
MNYLTVHGDANTVTYGNKPYRIQNDRGHLHIVVYENSRRKKITVKKTERDWCYDYIFGGLSVRYPCPAIDYFIHRHRLGNRISTTQYKDKMKVKILISEVSFG